MITKPKPNTSSKASAQVPETKHKRILLGLDVHADLIVVVRILDNSAPQPAQQFTRAQFVEWARKQLEKAEEVHSCYEAGPFGYGLHRKLEAMGVHNLVVQPVCLDERHTGVNNDKTDARALAMRLDRYVSGNTKALATVRIPSEAEEQKRAVSRQRDQLKREMRRLATQGRALMLTQEIREKGDWWKPKRWEGLKRRLAEWLIEALEHFRVVIEALRLEEEGVSAKILAKESGPRPKGLGPMTLETVDREVGNWDRFKNRRQVGSYTGLVGGVSSSGNSRRTLSITKHGNARLRTALVEAAWRMVMHQPESRLVKKWAGVLGNPRATKGARKKAVVGMARQLAVDLWRWRTGRVKPEDLSWEMMAG